MINYQVTLLITWVTTNKTLQFSIWQQLHICSMQIRSLTPKAVSRSKANNAQKTWSRNTKRTLDISSWAPGDCLGEHVHHKVKTSPSVSSCWRQDPQFPLLLGIRPIESGPIMKLSWIRPAGESFSLFSKLLCSSSSDSLQNSPPYHSSKRQANWRKGEKGTLWTSRNQHPLAIEFNGLLPFSSYKTKKTWP